MCNDKLEINNWKESNKSTELVSGTHGRFSKKMALSGAVKDKLVQTILASQTGVGTFNSWIPVLYIHF